MSKKIYIHAGLPKTGSSSIQTFLAKNRQKLESLGFYYPVNIYNTSDISRQMEGKMGSGNMRPLYDFIDHGSPKFLRHASRKPTKDEIKRFLKLFFTSDDNCLIYSNENIARLPREALLMIKKFLEGKGYEIKVIIFTRNDVDVEKSIYVQRIKSCSLYEPFNVTSEARDGYKHLFGKLQEIFNVHCIKYEKSKTNVIYDFLEYLGITEQELLNESKSENYRVNSEITAEELLVLRRLNYFHKNDNLSVIVSCEILEDDRNQYNKKKIDDEILKVSGEESTSEIIPQLSSNSIKELVAVWEKVGLILQDKLLQSVSRLSEEKEYSRIIIELFDILKLSYKNQSMAKNRLSNFKFKTFPHDHNKNKNIKKLVDNIKINISD